MVVVVRGAKSLSFQVTTVYWDVTRISLWYHVFLGPHNKRAKFCNAGNGGIHFTDSQGSTVQSVTLDARQ